MKHRIIILALLLLCAGAALATGYWLRSSDETIATISAGDTVVARYDLSKVRETTTFTVGEDGAQNTIRVSPEGIAVIRADCPDQVCVQMGTRQHGPEPIVCLPHKLTISFSADDTGLDAVAGR